MVRSWRRPRTSWPVSWDRAGGERRAKSVQVGSHVTNVTAAWPCSEARPASRLPVRTYGRVGLRSLLWRRIIFQAFGFLSLVSRVTPPRVSAWPPRTPHRTHFSAATFRKMRQAWSLLARRSQRKLTIECNVLPCVTDAFKQDSPGGKNVVSCRLKIHSAV